LVRAEGEQYLAKEFPRLTKIVGTEILEEVEDEKVTRYLCITALLQSLAATGIDFSAWFTAAFLLWCCWLAVSAQNTRRLQARFYLAHEADGGQDEVLIEAYEAWAPKG
ncbi:hypothetical protein FOZ62_017822, partial [Perkinsus olseni]